MIRVFIGNNAKREPFNFPQNITLRAALESEEVQTRFAGGFDYSKGTMHLDGSSVQAGDLNRTFAELGYDGTPGKDKCFLLQITKMDNAVA